MKREVRALDLAIEIGRKKQSPRTGFLHFFPADDTAADTIPIYENFLFAFALFRQKTAEAVLEGKELIQRLLAFQTEEGNFPLYLHDYPRCWDHTLTLKIAPVLIYLLREFRPILGEVFETKVKAALHKALQCAEKKGPLPPVWQARLEACLGRAVQRPKDLRAQEWFDWLVTMQLLGDAGPLPIPFHKEAKAFFGENGVQEGGEPAPFPFEYLLAEREGLSARLLRPHIHQLSSALLFPLLTSEERREPWAFVGLKEGGFQLLFPGDMLHTLCVPTGKLEGDQALFSLEGEFVPGRDDLYEVELFCNLSPETHLFVNGEKGSLFNLGDRVAIQTNKVKIDLQFSLLAGKGEFCGHISRANRPGQMACRGENQYSAYDWKIGLRTLRREGVCRVALSFAIEKEQDNAVEATAKNEAAVRS